MQNQASYAVFRFHSIHSPLHSSSTSRDYHPSRYVKAMLAGLILEDREQDLSMAHHLHLHWPDHQHFEDGTRFVPSQLEHLTEGQVEAHSSRDHHGLNLDEVQKMSRGDLKGRRSGQHYVDHNSLGCWYNPKTLDGCPVHVFWWLQA